MIEVTPPSPPAASPSSDTSSQDSGRTRNSNITSRFVYSTEEHGERSRRGRCRSKTSPNNAGFTGTSEQRLSSSEADSAEDEVDGLGNEPVTSATWCARCKRINTRTLRREKFVLAESWFDVIESRAECVLCMELFYLIYAVLPDMKPDEKHREYNVIIQVYDTMKEKSWIVEIDDSRPDAYTSYWLGHLHVSYLKYDPANVLMPGYSRRVVPPTRRLNRAWKLRGDG